MNYGSAARELLGGSKAPFIYGTAWKKDRTKALVIEAVKAGFTSIDTAAQPKHYKEEIVGDAVRVLLQEGVSREQLYVCWLLYFLTLLVFLQMFSIILLQGKSINTADH
jgi:hypothetical protein